MTLSEFQGLLTAVGPKVYHYASDLQDYPYIAYTEYDEGKLEADNQEQAVYDLVQVDYYTLADGDPVKARIRKLLNENEITFEYKIIREQGNGVFHHVFDCSLL